jgi:hypothetical protein
MARLVSWFGLVAWVALAAATGCSNTGTPCKKRGATQACSCSDGAKGSQQCLPERVWDKCDCSASSAMDAGGTGGAPGSGGMSGQSGSGGNNMGGSGGAGHVPPDSMGNKDGGSATDAMVAAGSDGGGSGGQGDGGGMGGSGGMLAPPPGNAYGKCTDESDCKVADSLCNVVSGVPPLSEDSSGCEPPCQVAGDCPMPAGSYDATVICVDEHCELDCAPPDPLGDDRSCPAGLTCTASLLTTTSSCLVP